MLEGILGTVLFLLVAGGVIWLIRKIADLVIGVAVLGSIVFIFITGMEGSLGATLSLAFLLGVLAPVVTMPLWPFSSSFAKDVVGYADRESVEKLEGAFQGVPPVLQKLVNDNYKNTLMLFRIEKEVGLPSLSVKEMEKFLGYPQEEEKISSDSISADRLNTLSKTPPRSSELDISSNAAEVFNSIGVRDLLNQINRFILKNKGEIVEEENIIRLTWPSSLDPKSKNTIAVQYMNPYYVLVAGEKCTATSVDVKKALINRVKEIENR